MNTTICVSNLRRAAAGLRSFGLVVLLAFADSPNLLAQRIPEEFDSRAVGFVFLPDTNGNPTLPYGTCFFVSVPTKPGFGFIYMVTAGHILKDETQTNLLPQVCVRLNKRGGGFMKLWFPLNQTNTLYRPFFHPESGVDLAIVPVNPLTLANLELDFKSFPSDHIATKEHMQKFQVRVGDEMFFMGLFTPFYGSTANVAIVRFGRLAMLTDQKIPTGTNQPTQNYYLMETLVFGGNSGSPSFFWFSPERNPGDTTYLVAGVIEAYYPQLAKIVAVPTGVRPYALENSGIALVIPGYRILELLNLPEVKKHRGE